MFEGMQLTADGKRIQKELKELNELIVAVGFPAGGPADEKGVSVAEYAAYNDLGTIYSPSRPFLRDSVNNHQADFNQFCAAAVREIMNGGTARQALEKLGVYAKGIVQEQITDGTYEANSETTIRRKGSAKPLMDTGLMRESVNYEIRKKG